MSVSMKPGATELTRMSRPASSWARLFANASRPAFTIVYGIWPGLPVEPTTLEMLMMRPLFLRSMKRRRMPLVSSHAPRLIAATAS